MLEEVIPSLHKIKIKKSSQVCKKISRETIRGRKSQARVLLEKCTKSQKWKSMCYKICTAEQKIQKQIAQHYCIVIAPQYRQNGLVLPHHGRQRIFKFIQEYYLHIVMEYIPDTLQRVFRDNRKSKISVPPLTRKIFIFQMFKALYYLKLNKICHRDLKPSNVLINTQTLQLKICDFGSAKIMQPNQKNIAYICSRAPQLIFGSTDYSIEIDMWSAGCIIVQMVTSDPIFPGDSSLEQLIEIIKILGTPNEQYMKDVKEHYMDFPKIHQTPWSNVLGEKVQQQLIDLIQKILTYDTKNRLTPYQALLHPYFKQISTYSKQLGNLPNLLDFHNLLNSQNNFQIETLERIYKRQTNLQNKAQSIIITLCGK